MCAELAITTTPYLIKAALVAGGDIQELMIIDPNDRMITERFLWGRVVRIDSRLDAAFLDCGLEAPVYLSAKDARLLKHSPKNTPIAKLVQEGQYILVQGLREPDADKGGRATADLQIFGHAMTLRPLHRGIEVSGSFPAGERDRQMARAEKLLPEDKGFLLRRRFAEMSDKEILTDLRTLESAHERLRNLSKKASRPELLPQLEGAVARISRHFADQQLERVTIDDPASKAAASSLFPLSEIVVARHGSAFHDVGIEGSFERLSSSTLGLPSGGRIVIQRTLAATVIDVDGAGGKALPTNLEAAREIARQIRLRNIGGTILVDFIDLVRANDRKTLETALRNATKRDRFPVQIYPMSPLGIIQISRAKRGRSHADWFSQVCGHCSGSGLIASPLSQAESLWRSLQARSTPARELLISHELEGWLEKADPKWRERVMAGSVRVQDGLERGFDIVG